MSRLAAIAEDLKLVALNGMVEEIHAQAEALLESGHVPVVEESYDERALARTAVDYVLAVLREEDEAGTLGEAVVLGANALAVEVGADPDRVVQEAVNFLHEAALTASISSPEPLVEGKADPVEMVVKGLVKQLRLKTSHLGAVYKEPKMARQLIDVMISDLRGARSKL